MNWIATRISTKIEWFVANDTPSKISLESIDNFLSAKCVGILLSRNSKNLEKSPENRLSALRNFKGIFTIAG